MSKEVLVSVNNVSKKFCRDLKTSLWYGVKDLISEFLGRNRNGELRPKEFYAVNDVSFELRRGECLGLIGHNGAGKSTLLKMLNGLIKPDKGSITMKGRIGALIELGAGFNPLLTGRENIYINGQVLGFTKVEIDKKFDAIVEFAEIGEFIDAPVQNYSSGMKVRLGFAVAAQMEPDVLLIDEVLAVGDIGFQIKCFNKINEIINKCAVIFVSHSMPNIGRLSTRAILFKSGKILIDSINSRDAIEAYYDSFKTEEKMVVSDVFEFINIEFNSNSNKVKFGNDLIFNLSFTSKVELKDVDAGISVMDLSLRIVGTHRERIGTIKKGTNNLEFRFSDLLFAGNRFYFSIEINRFVDGLKKEVFGLFRNIGTFVVIKQPFEVDSVVFLKAEVKAR